jgi:hypothetical protein
VVKVLAGFLGIGLLIYAVIDCSRTPEDEVPASLSRPGWLVLIILVPFLGPVSWLVASRTEGGSGSSSGGEGTGARRGGSGSGGGPAGGPRTSRPVGPDDDPDFLRGL